MENTVSPKVAASFALVYVSSWLKCHFPAAFACALLNSQPMGFYAPAQIIRDAKEHGVEVLPADINYSDWDNTLTQISSRNNRGDESSVYVLDFDKLMVFLSILLQKSFLPV